MKDQLTKLLMERVGLDEEKANKAVETVMGFIQENPAQLQGLLQNEQAQEVLSKLPGGLGSKVGKLFG